MSAKGVLPGLKRGRDRDNFLLIYLAVIIINLVILQCGSGI